MIVIRAIVFAIAVSVWLLILPVWLVMLAREVFVSAFTSVASVFGSKNTSTGVDRLDSIAKFWPNGFSDLYKMLLASSSESTTLAPVEFSRLLMETVLAILFYSAFFWWPRLFKSANNFVDVQLAHSYATSVQYFDEFMPKWMAELFPLFLFIVAMLILVRLVLGKRN